MTFLLDTNVLSALRVRRRENVAVWTWAATVSVEQQYISSISLMELEIGVLRVERRDPTQGRILRTWLVETILARFASRLLHIDENVARRCALLHVPNPKSDLDALIAATALSHGLKLVTRNVRDFADTGVAILNPWEPQSRPGST